PTRAPHTFPTRRSSDLYHFAAAMPAGTNLSPEDDAKFRKMRRHAFEAQDKPIIDAQQQAIGDADFWDLEPVLLTVDAGPVRMRRTLERMVGEEQKRKAAKAAPQKSHADEREPAAAG